MWEKGNSSNLLLSWCPPNRGFLSSPLFSIEDVAGYKSPSGGGHMRGEKKKDLVGRILSLWYYEWGEGWFFRRIPWPSRWFDREGHSQPHAAWHFERKERKATFSSFSVNLSYFDIVVARFFLVSFLLFFCGNPGIRRRKMRGAAPPPLPFPNEFRPPPPPPPRNWKQNKAVKVLQFPELTL